MTVVITEEILPKGIIEGLVMVLLLVRKRLLRLNPVIVHVIFNDETENLRLQGHTCARKKRYNKDNQDIDIPPYQITLPYLQIYELIAPKFGKISPVWLRK